MTMISDFKGVWSEDVGDVLAKQKEIGLETFA